MVEGDLGRRLIAVGGSHDRWVEVVLRVAAEYELAAARCDDVYAAVAEMAGTPGGCILAIGSLRELAREHGQFFRIAARHGACCAVLLTKPGVAERRDIVAAVRAGAWVIDTIDEIQGIVETWLAGSGSHSRRRSADEGFRATEAELDALLGQEADG